MARRSAFCADVSLEHAEPLAATASRVDHWILVEYRGLWGYDAVAASSLTDTVRAHILDRVAALGHAKVLFVRRPGGQSQFSAQLAAQTAARTPLRDLRAKSTEPNTRAAVPFLPFLSNHR